MSSKFAVHLDPENRFRVVYGGLFDIANTSRFSNAELKRLALFHEHVIVPDAFFYCYGSLFDHIYAVTSMDFDGEDVLTPFLQSGIIVPAIRSGESILHLWENRLDGVAPGRLASAEMEEGKRVLGYIDEYATTIARWPEEMARATTAEFVRLVNRFIVSDESSPIYRARRLDNFQSLRVMGSQATAIREAIELAEKFSEMTEAHLGNTLFRRGQIERLISDHLGSRLQFGSSREQDPRLYSSLAKLSSEDGGRDLNLLMCEYILNTSSTIYEAFHANQFHTLGGLFAAHDEDLIAEGVYQHIAHLAPSVHQNQRYAALLEGEFDASRLTAAQIIEIRKSDEFRVYADLVAAMKIPLPGESFQQANPVLCDHLVRQYLPYIVNRYPAAGMIQKIQRSGEILAISNAILGFLQTAGMTTVMLANHPILTLVTGLGSVGVIGEAGPISERLSKWRLKRMKRRRRNNYSVPIT